MPDIDLSAGFVSEPPKRKGRLPELLSFLEENKLKPGSTTGGRHNRGSKHYTENAVDIKDSGRLDLSHLNETAAARGFKLRDERVRPKGQKVWGGAHWHLEADDGPMGIDLSAGLDTPQRDTRPTSATEIDLSAGLIDDAVDMSSPVEQLTPQRTSSRFGAPQAPIKPSRQRRSPFEGVQAGVRGTAPPSGVGALRELDDPEMARRKRIEGEVKNYVPRILESKNPDDIVLERIAAEKSQEVEAAKQAKQYQEDKPEIDRLAKEYRTIIRSSGIAPTSSKWATEAVAKGGAGLTETLAGIVRASKYNPFAQGSEGAADAINIHAQAMQQAAMEEGADRNEASRFAQDIVGGFIGTAPELAAMSVGIPAPVAFAVGGGTRAYGGNRPVLPEAAHDAATGAAFEIPVAGQGLRRVARKAGAVGAATTGIELGTGATPRKALVTGATNAAMVGVPGAIKLRPRSKANAVSIGEPKATDVGQAPTDSAALGQRVPAPGKVTITQASGRGQAEGETTTPHHSTFQNRRVRNTANGTKGQFKKGIEEPPVVEEAETQSIRRVFDEIRARQTQRVPAVEPPVSPETPLVEGAQAKVSTPSTPEKPRSLSEVAAEEQAKRESGQVTTFERQQLDQERKSLLKEDEQLHQQELFNNQFGPSDSVERQANREKLATDRQEIADRLAHIENRLAARVDEAQTSRDVSAESRKVEPAAIAAKEPWEMSVDEFGDLATGRATNRFLDTTPRPALPSAKTEVDRIEAAKAKVRQSIADANDSPARGMYESQWKVLDSKAEHRRVVEKALREGKSVPPEVLADYPDLQKVEQPSALKVVSPETLKVEEPLVPETEIKKGEQYATVKDTEAVGEKAIPNSSKGKGGGTPVKEIPPELFIKLKPREKATETTSIKNAATAELRKDLDLLELDGPERKSFQKSIDNALAKGLDKKAEQIADDVISGKQKGLDDEEGAGIQHRMRELENRWEEVYAKGKSDPELADIEARLDNLTKATALGGTAPARALSFRRSMVDKDFKLISLIRRAKEAKARDLTKEERTRYETIVKERDKAVAERDAALETLHSQRLQRELDRSARQRSRAETKEALDKEAVVIKENIAAEFARLRTQSAKGQFTSLGGLGGLDPEGVITRHLLKYARNRAKANIGLKAEALIDEAHSLVKDFGVTRRQVAEVLAGYNQSRIDKRSEAAKKLAEIRAEINSLLSAEDIEAGKRSPRTEGPRLSDVTKLPLEGPRKSQARSSGIPLEGPKLGDIRRVPAEGPKQSEARSSGVLLQGPKLSDVRKVPASGPRLSEASRSGQPLEGPRLSEAPKLGPENAIKRNQRRLNELLKQEAEWTRRFNERDFAPRQKPEPYPYNSEVRRADDRVRIAEAKFNREMEAAKPGRWFRNASSIWKAWLLSGPPTQAMNIVGTGSYQAFREVARLPAAIGDVVWSTGRRVIGQGAQRSITGPSPSAMLNSVAQSAKVGGREFLETMKHGATKEQMERHQYKEIDTGRKLIDVTHNAVFRFMSGTDRVFYQGALQRNLIDRARVQAKNEGVTDVKARTKELIDNPPEQLLADARHDALVSTFNNSNRLSEKVKRARSAVIHPKSLMSRQNAERLNAAENFALDLVLPFDRTPTNVLSRIVEASPAGYVKNALQLIAAVMRKSMPVEHQRQMMQTFGNATTGSALIGLGWYLADKAKGVITVEDYDVFLNIPGLPKINMRTASPLGNIVAAGARLRVEHDKKGASWGDYAKPVLREPLNQPLLRASSTLSEFARDPERSAAKTGGRYASSLIPFSGAVRFAGKMLDPEEKRFPDPKSFKQQVQQNVPVWRQNLPAVKLKPRKQGKSAFKF